MFCLSNSPTSKDIEFTDSYDEEKHKFLTSENLETTNMMFFFAKIKKKKFMKLSK